MRLNEAHAALKSRFGYQLLGVGVTAILLVFLNQFQAAAHEFQKQNSLVSKECKVALLRQNSSKISRKGDYFLQFLVPPECTQEEMLLFDNHCGRLTQFMRKHEKSVSDIYLWGETCHEQKKLNLHFEFTCKAGLFSKTETYQVYGNWKTSKGEALDNMSPWYFIPIEASEDKERTLVIHETKLSAAIVTKTRRFSNSKGYFWDEEKFYCQREHYPH